LQRFGCLRGEEQAGETMCKGPTSARKMSFSQNWLSDARDIYMAHPWLEEPQGVAGLGMRDI